MRVLPLCAFYFFLAKKKDSTVEKKARYPDFQIPSQGKASLLKY